MKRILLTLALLLAPVAASAQCNGVFPNNTACGNVSGAGNLPRPVPLSSFPANTPGGLTGNVQTNNGAGGFAGITNTQLTALLNAFTATLSGAVPASGGGTVNYLRADGTFAQPGNVIGSGASISGNVSQFNNTNATGIADSGIPASALPTMPGQIPGAAPGICTVTITIASPGVVTCIAHGLKPNATVVFQDNGDTLPTGYTKGTTYYVVGSSITTNTFTFATSQANAAAGTAINTTGSQSGTHTEVFNGASWAGNVGEYLEFNNAGPTNVPTNTDTICVGGTFPPGVWLMQGNITYIPSGSGTFTEIHQDISIASGTLEAPPAGGSSYGDHLNWIVGDGSIHPTGLRVFVMYQSFTVNVVTHMTITAGTVAAGPCQLWGVRIR